MRAAIAAAALLGACATAAPVSPGGPREAAVLDAQRTWAPSDILPYAYVVDSRGHGDPSRPLFNDFILTCDDQDAWTASLFDPQGTATAALEEFGRRTDRTFRVWLPLPNPSRSRPEFATLEARAQALRDRLDLMQARTPPWKHVAVAGYVWTPMAMWETTGARHWHSVPDDNGDMNTDENLVAWLRDETERRGLTLLWLPTFNAYVTGGQERIQHLAPWLTHSDTGEPLFHGVYMSPERINDAYEWTILQSPLGMHLGAESVEDRPRLDARPVAFTLSQGPAYDRVVRLVERRHAHPAE